MDRIAHPIKICLSKEFGYGRNWNSCRLWYKNGVPTFPVRAGIVDVVFTVMMHIHRFPTNRIGWMFSCPGAPDWFVGMVFSPLMPTFLARILLTPMDIFSVGHLLRSEKGPFCCCTSGNLFDTILPWGLVSFLRVHVFVVKPLYQKGWRVLNFHLTLQSA